MNLLWAAALAVLAIIYLRSRSRPTIEVSSLMLFDEMPAPVARVRHLRIDPLFWLEVAALSALVLAIAGLYAMVPAQAGRGRSHALVFDLGAAMSAKTGSTSSIEEAKKQALAIVDDAPAGDEFYVITYALEAQVALPQTQNLDAVRKAIDGLQAFAVPAHASALAAAIMRARGASDIELFTSKPPPARAIADAGALAPVHVHQMPHGDDNVAIVSVDPGPLDAKRGRVVLRSFASKPRLAEVVVKSGENQLLDQTLMFAPREQMVVPFDLRGGGLISARIVTPDAIAADNQRWALAPSRHGGRALIASPDAAARDDLARILLAVNPDLQIETVDPARYHPAPTPDHPFELAVMHDCYVPGLSAGSILLIDPPAEVPPAARIPGISIAAATAPVILGADRQGAGDTSQGILLPRVRIVSLPEWMETVASGIRTGANDLVPLAAIGRIPTGRIGIIAFDVRDRMLLDPDKLDALLVTVDMVKRLIASSDISIVPTGAYAEVPAIGSALVITPDGSRNRIASDKWGRVRLRPMQSGRYTIKAGNKSVEVFADYYDASESDLAAAPPHASSPSADSWAERVHSRGPRQVEPLMLLLAALAMAAFAAESIVLVRRAARWGLGHV